MGDVDATDGEQPVQLLLRETTCGFVAGQAIFVQAPRLGPRFMDHHVMPQAGQGVRTGQTRRARADHRNALACGRSTGEQLGLVAVHHRIDGMALQAANGDGLALLGSIPRMVHAHLLAQHLGRADTGTHAAQRVGFQNSACRTPQVAIGNAFDEAGHVNVGRASLLARRIKAVQTALSLQHGLRGAQGGRGIREVVRVLGGGEATGTDIGGDTRVCTGRGVDGEGRHVNSFQRRCTGQGRNR